MFIYDGVKFLIVVWNCYKVVYVVICCDVVCNVFGSDLGLVLLLMKWLECLFIGKVLCDYMMFMVCNMKFVNSYE